MKRSAGILLYQTQPLSFFLVHPGGPLWKNKDSGAWSIPKGEFADDEQPLAAAIREFNEETGQSLEIDLEYKKLRPVRLKSGKQVYAWALEKYIDAENIASNTFEIEWPPRSGRRIEVPEVDKAAWFSLEEGMSKINGAQQAFLLEVSEMA
ncbi:NUDIX domain-containing protein [Flavobacterium selenitireducens]|uniref:NUDIX domain-containing protein n=1 Tax=Flavobacterium selenitireducens TaxID=2722704 RepID=UPI00168A7CF0|nr:NUDIX domain-containing protein [Flavobacterium selenitireducens]MBD3581198.1 NUDIX domain-containing protein [Flavobacterium selenitireducens]